MWEVYDIDRNKTGKVLERGGKMPLDGYHLVVHICIINYKSEMLIQQRQLFKDKWPGKWDLTVGGSTIAGENSREAAQRELFEEIGYYHNFEGVRPNISVSYSFGFDDYYIFRAEPDITDLKLQQEEVKQVKWASREEIFAMIDCGDFINYRKDLISLLFDICGEYGAMRPV